MSDINKIVAALAAIPQFTNLALNTIGQIEQIIPHSGTDVLSQKIAAVTAVIEGGVSKVAAGVTEIEALVPVAVNFAASVLTLINGIKAGTIATTPVAVPAPGA